MKFTFEIYEPTKRSYAYPYEIEAKNEDEAKKLIAAPGIEIMCKGKDFSCECGDPRCPHCNDIPMQRPY